MHGRRALDLIMMAAPGGREREEQDWHALFKEADERFRVNMVKSIHEKGSFGSPMGIIEAVWEG
jgi:hypothetical protein